MQPAASSASSSAFGRRVAALLVLCALVAGTLVSGWVFAGYLSATVLFLMLERSPGVGWFVLTGGPYAYWFVVMLRRLVVRDFSWPNLKSFLSAAVGAWARGWGVGVAILNAGEIARSLLAFGQPSVNGSYALDALYFVIVTILISIPALLALALGWLVSRFDLRLGNLGIFKLPA